MKSKFSVHFLLMEVLFITGLALAQGTRYAVQLGATPSQSEANARIIELRTKDVQAYIVKTNVPGKGIFYRIRVGMFADMNAAKKYGADLVRRGVSPDYFVAPYEQPLEEKNVAVTPTKPAGKPTPTPVNTAAPSNPTINTVPATSTPKQTPSEVSGTTPSKASSEPVSSAAPPTTTPAAPAAFAKYQDSSIGYSFEYPSYWTGQPLDPKDAADQRVNAGALFKSSEDSAFLNAIWNKLDKANSPENDNDLIVEIILKSMSSGDGTQLKETSRKVVSENGLVKTYLELKAAFQSQGQPTPLDFLGKAVIVRTTKGILLVVAFYSKDSVQSSAPIADRIIASVRAPE